MNHLKCESLNSATYFINNFDKVAQFDISCIADLIWTLKMPYIDDNVG